ncbi:TPA: hypothetical protein QEL76_003391 [Stenotrophomonas maltophilia]|nr:hypothetical protein [Stenotrophomonas maltophilia]
MIQPFDGAVFDKRYRDCFRPAILDAELEPYRVDGDPAAEVLISSIEEGIRSAAICLADITQDNANVWYELGFALALGKPVVMICATGRQKFPFDIQHRNIIVYSVESSSDFDELRSKISMTLTARLSKAELLKQAAESELVSAVNGISHSEVVALAAVASEISKPYDMAGLWAVKQSVERQGVTAIGFQLAMLRLSERDFVNFGVIDGEHESFDGVQLTAIAWKWIAANDNFFVLSKDGIPGRVGGRRPSVTPVAAGDLIDDDIPF